MARIMACPGSWAKAKALAAAGGTPPTSEYAAEGHAAHWLAEQFLTGALTDGDRIPDHAPNGVHLNGNTGLLLAVSTYLDEIGRIRGRAGPVACWAVEQTVSLDPVLEGLLGEDEMAQVSLFGTCDFVLYDPLADRLYVRDYKHGAGVPVPVRGADGRPNIQLIYYAIGALDWLDNEGYRLSRKLKIDLGIVQPRCGGEAVRRIELTYEELTGYVWDIAYAVRRTLQPDAPLNPGDHCRFCPALIGCEAIQKRAQELAKVQFGELDLDDPPTSAPELLTNEELATILDNAGWLRTWLGHVQAEASRRIARGHVVPGWKLTDKRAQRRWKDEAETTRRLLGRLHYDDLMGARQLKSPAQIEELLRRHKYDPTILDDLVTRESSGTTLVPDTEANAARPDRSGQHDPKRQFGVLDLDDPDQPDQEEQAA